MSTATVKDPAKADERPWAASKTTVGKVPAKVPAAFAEFDTLEGFNPIDKAELVGKPFGITGVRFRENERHVAFAEVEIITLDGEQLGFQDSSTGVRDQLAAYLAEKKLAVSGDWTDVKLYVPNGLRVSSYEVHDESGRAKQAKTYYLTLQPRMRG